MLVDNRFKVVVIGKGDSYGRNNVLTHDKDDELVEFWDTKHDQFVSRYYKSTLLEDGEYPRGLNLHGGVPDWGVSAEGMKEVINYLKGKTEPTTEEYAELLRDVVVTHANQELDGDGVATYTFDDNNLEEMQRDIARRLDEQSK